MPFYPCRGGGNRKFDFTLIAQGGASGSITGFARFPAFMLSKVEVYDLMGQNNNSEFTVQICGIANDGERKDVTHASANRNSISSSNPLILSVTESQKKYDTLEICIYGQSYTDQKAKMIIYPR